MGQSSLCKCGQPRLLSGSYCADCRREYQRDYRRRNPHVERAAALKMRFGITIAEYEEILASQKGVCAICFAKPKKGKRLCVDHDHDTGRVRGLLCDPCNTAIGLMQDNPDLLRQAAEYLE